MKATSETGATRAGADLSEALLREAFAASEDPEMTLFLSSLAAELAPAARTAASWREWVDPSGGSGELGRLDGHILREVIAEGSMAVVFSAEETALNRIVALKMLSPSLAGNPEARKRFLNEAKAAAGLDHENVLPLFRVGEGPVPYFTMRLVSGCTLQDRLDRGPAFSSAEWFHLARQVSGALGAAHAIGLIHRDIKPANLLQESNGDRLWVSDFGIAASIGDAATSGDGVLGTPRYMSPEQARNEPVDPRSDLFALGAVLYRCAAGEDLVHGESSAEVLASLLEADFVAVVEGNELLAPEQRRLLSGLLASRPEDRFADTGAFRVALEAEAASQNPPSSRRRSRLVVGLGAVLVCAALLAAAFVATRPFSERDAGVHALPEIRIVGMEGVFRDLESALAAASDGATLLLDGVFVCRKTHFGPVGRKLTLRSASERKAVVIASRPEEHALFLRGPTELIGIDFVRETAAGNLVPIVGFHGGEAVVRGCRFETAASKEVLLGPTLSFTHLGSALVESCTFVTPGREALFLAFEKDSPPMKVIVRDCVFLSGTAMMRRVWGGGGALEVECERSVFVGERLFLEHPNNRPDSGSTLAFRVRGSGLDLAKAAFHFANADPADGADSSLVEWHGSGNRHASASLRLEWSKGDAAPAFASKSVELAAALGPPLSGSEVDLRIDPLRSPGGQNDSLAALLEILRDDPKLSALSKGR